MSEDIIIKLKSNDEKEFTINKKAVERSRLVAGILADYEDNTEVPLPDVNGTTLGRIVEYLKHYENSEPKPIPKPLKNSHIDEILDEWDFNFVDNIPLDESIDLLNAANYMDIAPLLQLACCRIAREMIDRPVEEVRELFGITSDMSKEEMEEMDKYPID
jgi:hypothetical protein